METFDVVPFDLNRYSEYEKEYFDSFNTALDEFFGKKALEQVAEVKEAEKKEKTLGVYERRLLQQEESLKKFEKILKKIIPLQKQLMQITRLSKSCFPYLTVQGQKATHGMKSVPS